MCLLVTSSVCQVIKHEAWQGNQIKEAQVTEGSDEVKEPLPPPNLIVLLADDLGYGDLSISGHPTSRYDLT